MFDFFQHLFDTSDFPPRWHCGAWTDAHGWLHILSDLGVWSAYLAIPCVLAYFVLRRKDIPFRKIFVLFAAFIVACGTTHLMEALIFWWPAYRLAGLIKLFTAVVSWSTVIALIPAVPKVLAMRSPEELEREITARKLAEENMLKANVELERRVQERTAELQEAALALKEANRRKDEFLATLAHELRNPLAPIRNSLHLMSQPAANAAVQEKARATMERQLKQLVRLVDDLLDINRISKGKLQLVKTPLELSEAINSAVETSRPLIVEMQQELHIDLPPEPVVVDADLVRLAQALMNLLNNAAKYSPKNTVIDLKVERKDSEALITVRDHGIGIASEQLPRIFDIFSQVDPALDRSRGGLGIGLSLVKSLVELHGGTIEARSEGLGKGSEFTIRLPIAKAPSARHSEVAAETPVSTKLRILIVDDNEDSAESLGLMLKLQGNAIQTAYDGEQALAMFRIFKPNVILLDIGMPNLNGYEACRKIREQPGGSDVVIIAQTGWGQEVDRQRTKEAGFTHHLVKPLDPNALMKLLAEVPPIM